MVCFNSLFYVSLTFHLSEIVVLWDIEWSVIMVYAMFY